MGCTLQLKGRCCQVGNKGETRVRGCLRKIHLKCRYPDRLYTTQTLTENAGAATTLKYVHSIQKTEVLSDTEGELYIRSPLHP